MSDTAFDPRLPERLCRLMGHLSFSKTERRMVAEHIAGLDLSEEAEHNIPVVREALEEIREAADLCLQALEGERAWHEEDPPSIDQFLALIDADGQLRARITLPIGDALADIADRDGAFRKVLLPDEVYEAIGEEEDIIFCDETPVRVESDGCVTFLVEGLAGKVRDAILKLRSNIEE